MMNARVSRVTELASMALADRRALRVTWAHAGQPLMRDIDQWIGQRCLVEAQAPCLSQMLVQRGTAVGIPTPNLTQGQVLPPHRGLAHALAFWVSCAEGMPLASCEQTLQQRRRVTTPTTEAQRRRFVQ